MKESYLTTLRLASGDVAPASPQTDFVRDAVGNMKVVTPSGVQSVATTESVASAITAKLKKVQLTGTGAVAITSMAHTDAEVHINTGITSVTMAVAAWTPAAPNIQIVELYNDTNVAIPVTIAGFSGGISVDGDVTNDIGASGTLISIPVNGSVQIYADADGWVRAKKLTVEVTQADLAAKQALLVSGTNIKTVNGASLLGVGNIATPMDLAGGVGTSVPTTAGITVGTGSVVLDGTQAVVSYATVGTTTFTPPDGVTSVRVLVIAGGGGGGRYGGGGGAGGFVENSAFAVTPNTPVVVTVGGGGAASTGRTVRGVSGGNSVFSTITSAGGGGGGSDNNGGAYTAAINNGAGGGCGGGAAYIGGATAGVGTQGYNGGLGHAPSTNSGGGGGAGGAGVNAVTGATGGGAGGAGLASTITGTSVLYAGGGGGMDSGAAGAGGGGVGAVASGASGAGTNGKGGGGGGAGNGTAASGGSGTVIIRFTAPLRTYNALQSYADNAAALAGGRLAGEFYKKTADGSVQQVI